MLVEIVVVVVVLVAAAVGGILVYKNKNNAAKINFVLTTAENDAKTVSDTVKSAVNEVKK